MKIHCSTFVLAVAAGLCVAAGAHAAPRTSGSPQPGEKPRLSEAQLAEAQARAALADEIVRNVGADAQAKGLDDSWRVNMLSLLYGTPSGALRDIRASATTLEQAHAQAFEARPRAAAAGHAPPGEAVAADLGSATDSLVFNPMTPCRFIDTRIAGGPIDTSPRPFNTNDIGISYGGSVDCAIPKGAHQQAIAANVTIVNPSVAAGYLTVRPAGSTNVTSWLNWYQGGAVTANAGVTTTAPNSSSSAAIEVLTGGGSAHVVLDIFGYFSASPPTAVFCRDGVEQAFNLPAGFSGAKSLPATCPSGMAATAPICDNKNGGVVLNGLSLNGFVSCAWNNQTGSSVVVFQRAWCCQVP